MSFPSPTTQDPVQRFEEASVAARGALEELIVNANQAGWGTDEITVALVDAADLFKQANNRDPDPADDPAINDAVPENKQLGRGDVFG